MVNNNREVANEIYNFIIDGTEGNEIPPLKFDINDVENWGLVFRAELPDNYYYFGNIGNYKFSVFYFSPNGDDSHFKQLNNLDYIIKRLNELKQIKIKNVVYNIITVFINGEPWPQTNWTIASLNNLSDESQIYGLELVIHLEKEGMENGDSN